MDLAGWDVVRTSFVFTIGWLLSFFGRTRKIQLFFPVHPLAAALQDLGVVEQDVESSASTSSTKRKRFGDLTILGPPIPWAVRFFHRLDWLFGEWKMDKIRIYPQCCASICSIGVFPQDSKDTTEAIATIGPSRVLCYACIYCSVKGLVFQHREGLVFRCKLWFIEFFHAYCVL